MIWKRASNTSCPLLEHTRFQDTWLLGRRIVENSPPPANVKPHLLLLWVVFQVEPAGRQRAVTLGWCLPSKEAWAHYANACRTFAGCTLNSKTHHQPQPAIYLRPPSSIFHLLRTQIPRSFPLRAAEPATSAACTRVQPTCLGTTSRRPAHVAASTKVLSNNRIASTPQSLSLLSPRPDNSNRLTPLLIECSNAGHSCAPPSCLPGQSASGSGGGVFISAALPLPPSRWERLPRQCSPSIGRLWYVTHTYTHTYIHAHMQEQTHLTFPSPSSSPCTSPRKHTADI